MEDEVVMSGLSLQDSCQPEGPPANFSQLSEDLLTRLFRASLPDADEDGYLPCKPVAQLCLEFSCCRAWRRSLAYCLSSSTPGHQGLRLLCCGSDAELAWLRSPWLPVAAAKFTHQLERGGDLVWCVAGRGHAATLVESKREEGLEVRRRDVLSGLPQGLGELFLDFLDSPVDLGWLPPAPGPSADHGGGSGGSEDAVSGGGSGREDAVSGGGGGGGRGAGPAGRLRLRLRSPADCVLGERELAAILAAGAGALELEASAIQLVCGEMEGPQGSPAERLQSGLALVAATAQERGLSSLSLTFKDLALLSISPACSIRLSLVQLLQRAREAAAEHAAAGATVALRTLPGRQYWHHLEASLRLGEEGGGEEGAQEAAPADS